MSNLIEYTLIFILKHFWIEFLWKISQSEWFKPTI